LKNFFGDMSINWKKWNFGRKLMFISSVLALFSLFLPWIDIGIASRNGFSTLGFILLIFYIYPIMNLLKDKEIIKIRGYISSILAVIAGIGWVMSNQATFMGKSINTSGSGLVIFIISSIILVIAVWKYEK
tara:strand:+ start:178 stop:570 length:393 start_codon:yes stop_codon:yes gene_type:complete